MKIIRVFPRKIRSTTPIDDLVRINCGPDLFDEADEIHISVAFTWDKPKAEILAEQWRHVAPVNVGGPAYNEVGGVFIPGMYIKHGYVITSRGCPNNCWFCSVPKREGRELRELPVTEGWNVLDDNLLACSDKHIKSVFSMLKRQKHRAEFTGGLEAARLNDWHIDELSKMRVDQMFFAYDTPDDYEPLRIAAKKLTEAGFNRHKLRAYVLIGYPKDTIENAEYRLRAVIELGMFPMAMLYHGESGKCDKEWKKFQREWARPSIIYRKVTENITNGQ